MEERYPLSHERMNLMGNIVQIFQRHRLKTQMETTARTIRRTIMVSVISMISLTSSRTVRTARMVEIMGTTEITAINRRIKSR